MILRVARHTNQLDKIVEFYTDVLKLKVLGSFEDHDKYDGTFIGKENADWHIEFTQSDVSPKHKADDDDILVLYPSSTEEFESLLNNIKAKNIDILPPNNPYWEKNGVLIKDPDGFNVIISPTRLASISLEDS